MTKFRNRYGKWPDFNNRHIKPVVVSKKPQQPQQPQSLILVEKELEEMRVMGEIYNVDFFVCETFELVSSDDKFHILLSGEELNIETSIYMYLDYIEDILG